MKWIKIASCLSETLSSFSRYMQHLKPRMSRLTFIHLLLAWLLLVASQQRFSSGIKVQAAEAGKQLLLSFPVLLLPVLYLHFKLKPAQLTSKSHKGNVLPVWVAEKRFHKSPSGPNPVGNHNPPSKQ
ncbi:hypothetical protein SADUNF_Sadunf16G0129400 [Salix dunnii]|uniref:Uncharacterized protein n=1 Tax=Salix dunnii TaxID=1413687 RepID=A0A835J9X5_9ROSI|nr:hypothetical protein SADUNF_Sadunf16G0129400 [Salix dunnii]